ncbi:hypothetical protein GCM10011371_03110 [Novosphingobium marinum]|uniref:Aminoglycoside phosphotransferase (APT) family kinase protein n=1 Tax=Novosphingobium marinum TaxID=1514948 RepID=A0A7Y9XVM9_9SPHN|nr:phosphotransferase family protein [Novosphingobium marinum]NYH94003.1 aminoglycoside phosphotransferase (APT) family kinase protein [Novosphingobium marinum]GGC18857.1 hypothetical protein GCM10011371_03110 [Novosphingobium marinum]
MGISQYLWSTARDLRANVMPRIEDGTAREKLHNGLRLLTWVANALEEAAPDGSVPPGPGKMVADTDRLSGPAENAAAWRTSGTAIAEAAKSISATDSATALEQHADVIEWEKAALDQVVARVDAIEYGDLPSDSLTGAEIDRDRLQDYLRERCGNPGLTIASFTPVHGGRSRQTALFSVEGASTMPADMVVQRGLPGGGGGGGFVKEDVQFDLMKLLYDAGVRVPEPVLIENDESHLGAPFLLTARASGSCAEPDFWLVPDDPSLVSDLAREMALLHSQPIATIEARLPQSRQRYDVEGWREELETFARQWDEMAHWPSVTMSAAIAWMRANVDCLEDRRTLVHNDFLFHNIMADGGRITAVLDWEMTSIGHPGEDLGYAYPQISRCGDWSTFLDAYRTAGGPFISQRQIDYFALRAGLRLMILVMRGGRDAFEKGLADGVLPATAGAHFSQRLLHRIATILADVRARG